MAAGDESTAAFIFLASAGTAAGPAGAAPACAHTLTPVAITHARVKLLSNPLKTRFM